MRHLPATLTYGFHVGAFAAPFELLTPNGSGVVLGGLRPTR